MCVDCVLASPRIAQVDPDDEPLPEVILSQLATDNLSLLLEHSTRHLSKRESNSYYCNRID
jgi:hypothetical protein